MLKLFLDSDCDIDLEYCKKHNATMISMPYIVDDKCVYPYKDFEVFDGHAFYDTLRNGKMPTTAALSEDEYIAYFEPEFAAGNDIIYIHFSAAMTVTFDFMARALETLKAKYPHRKFYSIDVKGITIGGMLGVEELVDRLESGMSAEELVEFAKTDVDKYACYFFADDLKFFKRSGRVSGLAAFMGGLIGIRPIININDKGVMGSCGKEKGLKKTIDKLLSIVDELGDDIKNHHVIVGHTDAPELANKLKDGLKEKYGQDLEVEIVYCNPTAGSHCGPNGAGIAFYAKHR